MSDLKKQWTPPPHVVSEVYPNAIIVAREVALELGYAIAVHGSQKRDLDLIAAPWIEDACEPQELANAIAKKLKWWVHEQVSFKPHGRVAFTIYTHDRAHIDLSVMPKQKEHLCKSQ